MTDKKDPKKPPPKKESIAREVPRVPQKPGDSRQSREVTIPPGVEATLEGRTVKIKGPKGSLQREFRATGITLKKTDTTLRIESRTSRRQQKATVGTIEAHIKNMVQGVTHGFQYRMKVCYSHFPIQVAQKGPEIVISNFLGEKKPRRAHIIGDTKVEIKGDTLLLTGTNVEEVGQSAANIEQASKIRDYDPRVFQDGIYIVAKAE